MLSVLKSISCRFSSEKKKLKHISTSNFSVFFFFFFYVEFDLSIWPFTIPPREKKNESITGFFSSDSLL